MMRAADARKGDLRAQLDAGYVLLAHKDSRALVYLRRAAQIAPRDARVQEQLGYSLLSEGDLDGALEAFRAALAENPGNDRLRMQVAYTEGARGRKGVAAREALAVSKRGAERARDGCRAWHNLAGLPDRVLPRPWFGEFYWAPEYGTQGHVAVLPLQARLGYSILGEDVLSAYASIRSTRDNRSGVSGIGSEIFFDNHAVIAGGFRLRPFDGAPVFVFVEQGAAYDLIDRGRGSRWGADTRAGFVAGYEWALEPRHCGSLHMSLVPVADIYGEAIWYSRYDNMIGFARIRPGLRLVESDHLALELYGIASVNTDTAGRRDNRLAEMGAGFALKLYAPLRIALRVEGVDVKRSGQSSVFDRRIRIEQEYRF